MITGTTENMVNLKIGVSDDLEFLFKKYLSSINRNKPNQRLANQLKIMIDCIQIREIIKTKRKQND